MIHALWDFAFDKKVLLATPTNLIAIARSVASVWQQEALARNARDIALLGKELYDRLAKVWEDLRRVGTGLNSAVTISNLTNSFNSRLVPPDANSGSSISKPVRGELEDVPAWRRWPAPAKYRGHSLSRGKRGRGPRPPNSYMPEEPFRRRRSRCRSRRRRFPTWCSYPSRSSHPVRIATLRHRNGRRVAPVGAAAKRERTSNSICNVRCHHFGIFTLKWSSRLSTPSS